MALSYKTRRRLSLLILLLALPVYVVAVVSFLAMFDRLPFWAELATYVGFGILWAVPLKVVFKGVGQADPDARPDTNDQKPR